MIQTFQQGLKMMKKYPTKPDIKAEVNEQTKEKKKLERVLGEWAPNQTLHNYPVLSPSSVGEVCNYPLNQIFSSSLQNPMPWMIP